MTATPSARSDVGWGREATLDVGLSVRGRPISYSDAEEMLRSLCDGQVLDKVRHVIIHADAVWHVDVYEGILNGVVLAEVELQQANQKLNLPGWVGEQVTGDARYRKINMLTQRIVDLAM